MKQYFCGTFLPSFSSSVTAPVCSSTLSSHHALTHLCFSLYSATYLSIPFIVHSLPIKIYFKRCFFFPVKFHKIRVYFQLTFIMMVNFELIYYFLSMSNCFGLTLKEYAFLIKQRTHFKVLCAILFYFFFKVSGNWLCNFQHRTSIYRLSQSE